MSDLISLHHDHDTREAKRKRSKVSTKRLQEEEQVDNEEEQLTQKLFGTNTGTSPTVGCDDGELEASAMGSSTVTPRDIPASESHSIKSPWTDSDDCTIDASGDSGRRIKKLRDSRNRDSNWNHTELESRLRKRYKETAHLSSKTQWANVNRESAPHDTDPSLGQVLSLSRATLASNFSRLPSNVLDIVRLKDANESDPSPAVLKSVCFHPESNPDEPLLMTAGLDKTLRFFTVNSSESTKVHGVHFPRMPIYKASFLPASGNVVATGRRSFFYIYDMAHGKVDFVPKVLGRDEKSWEDHYVSMDGKQIAFVGNDGYIVLLDAHHRHVTGQLKINGSVRSIAFHQDGTNIFASGSDGEIYRFDLRSLKCVERFSNHDGTVTSSLAVSSNHIAAGAESGIVNVYANSKQGREPVKSVMNLHTATDNLRFNDDGQILAMSSRYSANCLRMMHIPTMTVFSNWPTSKTPLNYIFSMDFSPKSQYFAVGNDKGKCLLYHLPHFQ